MTGSANRGGVARLWLLNFFGNAAALAAWYFWLLVPDAHGWQVALSLVAAVAIVLLVAWLRAGTFAYFRRTEFRERGEVWLSFRHAVRHIYVLVLWAIALAAVLLFLFRLRVYSPQFGVWLWQKLPESLRVTSPRGMAQGADGLLWVLFFVVAPGFWLPVATSIAAAGWRARVLHSLRATRHVTYWVWFFLLIAVCVYLPYRLIWWIPDLDTLRKQAWSMGLRFFAAYVLVITAWIALVWMTGVRTEKEDPGVVGVEDSPS